MSSLIATVSKIHNIDNLNVVEFDFFGDTLTMMSLDLNDDIKVGVRVELLTKPTAIAIAKDFQGTISYSNQLKAEIVSCSNGQLLSSIIVKTHDATVEGIITLGSSMRMDLRVGESVTLLIKASELSISRVL